MKRRDRPEGWDREATLRMVQGVLRRVRAVGARTRAPAMAGRFRARTFATDAERHDAAVNLTFFALHHLGAWATSFNIASEAEQILVEADVDAVQGDLRDLLRACSLAEYSPCPSQPWTAWFGSQVSGLRACARAAAGDRCSPLLLIYSFALVHACTGVSWKRAAASSPRRAPTRSAALPNTMPPCDSSGIAPPMPSACRTRSMRATFARFKPQSRRA